LIDPIIDILKNPFVIVVLVLVVLAALVYLYAPDTLSRALSYVRGLLARTPREIGDDEHLKTIVQGWKTTGYIDFSVPHELRGSADRQNDPGLFYLTVEEHRLIKTIGGATAVERRWRRATLAEAREAAANYYTFLQEHPDKALNEDPRRTIAQNRTPSIGSAR
jgi:hypothetical protein